MRLLLINGNTTQAVTDRCATAARAVARPETKVVAVTAASGPRLIGTRTENALAAASIVDLFGIAKAARVAISGDTGPLHIAGAVGTPLVALFGPTFAERNGPWNRNDVVVKRTDQCDCLYQRQCHLASPCIDAIPLDEVVSAVVRRVEIANG